MDELQNIDLEFRPGLSILRKDGGAYLSDGVSNYSFHAHVGLDIDDFKQKHLDELLQLWGQIQPDILVGSWSKIGEAESKLSACKSSELGRV